MIPEFEAKGTPVQRGGQLGRRFKGRIQDTLPHLEPQHQKRQMVFVEAMHGYLEENFPEILEEIRGIAQGAEVSFDAAFLKSTYNSLGPALHDAGCSSIAFTTTDVGPILGKTDDGGFRPDRNRSDGLAILTLRSDEGYDILCMNEVGTVWSECGINEKGLCLGTNSGHPTMPGQDGRGVPQHIVPRLVLRHCANVKEAVDLLRRTPLTGKGINIVLADAEGNAAATENTYTMHGVREPGNGVVFSTNHYFATEMQREMWKWDPKFIRSRYFQNSLNRIAHLYGRFSNQEPKLTFQEMKETLMDDHNPGGLCQHPENNDANMATNFATIFVSRKREMWLNEGLPSRDRFERYVLN